MKKNKTRRKNTNPYGFADYDKYDRAASRMRKLREKRERLNRDR